MWISKRALTAVSVAALATVSLAFAGGAFGASKGSHPSRRGHHGVSLIKESLAPSLPSDPMFHGVSAGNAPWVLKRGDVRVNSNGQLDLRLKGLVIPALGTPGPVTTISASLYCGADSNMTAAASTQQVPISRKGDARIHDRSFSVPRACLAPVILVHPNGLMNLYISVDGWRL